MTDVNVEDLLIEALETERGEVQIYETASKCAENEDLRSEWRHQAGVAARHAVVLEKAIDAAGLDADRTTTASSVVHYVEATLVRAMEMALESAPAETAELVAVECVSFAEARDRLNWERLEDSWKEFDGDIARTLEELSTEVTSPAG